MEKDSFDNNNDVESGSADFSLDVLMPEPKTRRQKKKRTEDGPVQTPFETFLRETNEVPLLTRPQEQSFAKLKKCGDQAFQKQSAVLQSFVLAELSLASRLHEHLQAALLRIKMFILRRETEILSDHPVDSKDLIGDSHDVHAAVQRMSRAARIAALMNREDRAEDRCDDASLLRKIFILQENLTDLCNRISTSEIPQIGALVSIAREAFTELRAVFPKDHPCQFELTALDDLFALEVSNDAESFEYLAPLLAQRIVEKIHTGTPGEIFVRANLRLVVNIARSYTGKGVALFDLVQEGILGLSRSVDGFDHSMNFKFSTYASYWIKQSMKRAIANQQRDVRLPAYMVELIHKWSKKKKELHKAQERPPTDEEVKEALQIPAKKFAALQKALRQNTQVNGLENFSEKNGDEITLGEMLPARDPSATEVAEFGDDQDLVDALLGKMDPYQAQIIRWRYPRDGSNPKTLEEIGKFFGVTRESIRQNEAIGLQKLRNAVRDTEDIAVKQEDSKDPIFFGEFPVLPRVRGPRSLVSKARIVRYARSLPHQSLEQFCAYQNVTTTMLHEWETDERVLALVGDIHDKMESRLSLLPPAGVSAASSHLSKDSVPDRVFVPVLRQLDDLRTRLERMQSDMHRLLNPEGIAESR